MISYFGRRLDKVSYGVYIRNVFKLISFFIAMIIASSTFAADCRIIGQSCVEGPETRNIAGNQLYQACWRYTSKYECIKPDSVDYCAAISKIAGCFQTSTSCVSAAWNGTCLTEQRTYRCSDPSMPAPTNTVKLDNTYTIIRDELDQKECSPLSTNPLCFLASHICVEPAETRIINGLPVHKDCWKYKDDYSCIDRTPKNDCQPLIDKGCKKLDESCIESTDPFGCVMKQITYSCITKQGTTTTEKDCSTRSSCYDGTCWDTSFPNDTDFAKAVAAKEAARQAGVYGANGELFGGVAESCTKGYGGIKNCCGKSSGAKNNNSMVGTLAGSAAVGAVQYGGKYVYDYAYNNAEWIRSGSSALGIEHVNGADFTIGVYGLTWTAGAVPATSLLGGPIYGLGGGFYFDPYSFAIAVAIQVVMELRSCEPEEQQLSMHRGQNLCHLVGSYCSKKVLGSCMETTQAYCCYNSRLGKIINEQGKPQIGKGWGTPENPSCGGFSVDEFQRVDFSKLDLTEFIDDVMAATELPDVSKVQQAMTDKLKNVTTNPMNH
ncbi:conjugal transfer protein TraN [Pseudomonas syringae]|uniref:conjugal transfer protein TraN n=1 Tax=Pseudomonas syringae TaxID=317 RepID=UPI0002D58270|nr:conjugal transfer protein TraN [Pseudomonas syringae]